MILFSRSLLFLVLVTLAQAAGDVPAAKVNAIDINSLRTSLGRGAKVFEINRGEAAVGLPYLKRIEVTTDTALLTVRNEGKTPLAPRIEAEFFNAYGMRLCVVVASFEAEPVPAGGVSAKQLALALPNLDRIFAVSSMALPADWKLTRFVAVQDTAKQQDQLVGASATQPAIDPRRSRTRPQVVRQQQVRPAILSENKFGSTNIGNIALDARWSNYGGYLQRMIDSVQIQWERLILSLSAMPAIGSTVTIKFIMNDEGLITEIRNVDTTANETASRACVSAITDRAPYGPWTDDMKAVLGTQQEMTFTFYYQ